MTFHVHASVIIVRFSFVILGSGLDSWSYIVFIFGFLFFCDFLLSFLFLAWGWMNMFNLFWLFLLFLNLSQWFFNLLWCLFTPIICKIHFNIIVLHRRFQIIFQTCIIWFLLKLHVPSIIQKHYQLLWVSFAQNLGRSGNLFLHNHLILCLSIFSFHILPRQNSTQ